jgi:hypothetical protein
MLNGQSNDSVGSATCHKHNGSSVVDYMFTNGEFKTFGVFY